MDKKEGIKEYAKGELTVVWEAKKCIHAANCANGLPDVFNPNRRPWINTNNATIQEIKDQIDKCPSGALSYYMKEDSNKETGGSSIPKVQVVTNGPVIIHGSLNLCNDQGEKQLDNRTTAFCRCGASANKPFCDGSHKKIGFEG